MKGTRPTRRVRGDYQRALKGLAREMGFALTFSRGDHIQLRRAGCRTVTASATPRNERLAIVRVAAQMRRAISAAPETVFEPVETV